MSEKSRTFEAVAKVKRQRIFIVTALAGLLFLVFLCFDYVGLPYNIQAAMLRMLPKSSRQSYVDYTLSPQMGQFRGVTEKIVLLAVLEEAHTSGAPLVPDYRSVIPYTGGYMSRTAGVRTGEMDDLPFADNLIFMGSDKGLVAEAFAFQAPYPQGVDSLCQAMYRMKAEGRFPEARAKHCTGPRDYRAFYDEAEQEIARDYPEGRSAR